MKHQDPSNAAYESPFAMTILPAKGRGRDKHAPPARPPAEPVAPQQQAPAPPAAPQPGGFPQQAGAPQAMPVPVAAGLPMGAPPQPPQAPQGYPQPPQPPQGYPQAPQPQGYPQAPQAPQGYAQPPQGYPQPPQPPQGYAQPAPPAPQAPGAYPLMPGYPAPDASGNPVAPAFTDVAPQAEDGAGGHHHAEKSSRRRTGLLVGLLVVALGAGGYYAVPKYVLKHDSTPKTTAVLPASVTGSARQTSGSAVASAQAILTAAKKADPALALTHVAIYGGTGQIVVVAGQLPTTVPASSASQQVALVGRINKGLAKATGGQPDHLTSIPQAGKNAGQWWCGAAVGSDQPATDCIGVDASSVIVVSVTGAKSADNLKVANEARAAIIKH